MKKTTIIAGMSALMLLSASAGVYAGSNLQEIKAYLNKDIKFEVNKKAVELKSGEQKLSPITYNNTTYVPLRSAGELLGADIQYDSKSKTIQITPGHSGANTNTDENPSKFAYTFTAPAKWDGKVKSYTYNMNELKEKFPGFGSAVEYMYKDESVLMIYTLDKAAWDKEQSKDEPPFGELVTVKGQTAVVAVFPQSNPFDEKSADHKEYNNLVLDLATVKRLVK